MSRPVLPTGRAHLAALTRPLRVLEVEVERLDRWGAELASRLSTGARLLVAGNGGSAAQAQHLTAELVGRYRDDRAPLSALSLHAETSSCTAIANDYSLDDVFARQVQAHGRPGDIFLGLSTSGQSVNVVCAAEVARNVGLTTWALTGPLPNSLAALSDDALCVEAPTTATIQEVHLVALHMVCAAVDVSLGVARASSEPAVHREEVTL